MLLGNALKSVGDGTACRRCLLRVVVVRNRTALESVGEPTERRERRETDPVSIYVGYTASMSIGWAASTSASPSLRQS